MIDKQTVLEYIDSALDHVVIPEQYGVLYHRGKVRDVYRNGEELILIASDRISAFDHILRQRIPFKGQVLNQLAQFFFGKTRDIVGNHVIAIPDPNVTIGRFVKPLPIEFVIRGYLAGHAWREYKVGKRTLCGVSLPDGLQENSQLPYPILTPATKAKEGHDEDISTEEIINRGIISRETLHHIESIALKLFDRGSEIAQSNGLILVDTKYEFGVDKNNTIIVIDEIHTPDSSRYFYHDTYDELLSSNLPQRQLSKEFVREWLMANNFRGLDGQVLPDMPNDFVADISLRYIELYEKVTGHAFVPDLSTRPQERIASALQAYYNEL
ncbi:MAG: phosphoribosylaminoimidazolesuccinocarboxamide synthase [Rhodothermales bacterium]